MTEQLSLFDAPDDTACVIDTDDEALVPAWFTKQQEPLPASAPSPQFTDVVVSPWRAHLPKVFVRRVGPTAWSLSIAAPPAASIDLRLSDTDCKTIVKHWARKDLSGGVFIDGGEIGLVPWLPEISIRLYTPAGDIRQLLTGDLAEETIHAITNRTTEGDTE